MSKQIIPQSGSVRTDIVDISNANFDELYGDIPRTSHLGLSSGNTPTQNMEALRVAITGTTGHTEIYVDGLYELDNGWIELTKDLRLTGPPDRTCGFILGDEITVFRAVVGAVYADQHSFICENIQIKRPGFWAEESKFFYMFANEYYETVIFDNCYIEGSLRVVQCKAGEYNPANDRFGIGHFKVINNVGQDIWDYCFLTDNLYSKEELCANNHITNLAGTWFMSSLDNGTTTEPIADVRTNIIIRDNVVINDDDFYPSVLPTNIQYVNLANVEALNISYTGNHVEGLKISSSPFGVYDIYASCTFLIYDNNTWLNNVCFDPSYTSHNMIMKSKGSPSSAYTQSYRQYTNSTWRIDDAWLDRVDGSGKTISDCWNNFYEFPNDCDIVMKNNVIDVKGITSDSYIPFNSVDISNNSFIFDYVKEGSTGIFYFGSNEINSKDSFFNNNTITIKNNPLAITQSLISVTNAERWNSNWTINDNTVICDNTSIGALFAGFECEQLNISNNTFNTQHTKVFGYCKIDRLTGRNNIFNTTNPTNIWGADTGKFIMKEADFEMTSFNTGTIKIPLNQEMALSGDSWFKVTVSNTDGNGLDSFSFKYRLYEASGITRANFIKEDGSEYDEELTGQTNTYMYLERHSGFDNGTRIFFWAHDNVPNIYSLSGEPTWLQLKKLKIEVVQGNSGLLTELKPAIKPQAYTFATLPSSPADWDVVLITDGSTVSYRATASGGGSEVVLVMWDGTNWIYN